MTAASGFKLLKGMLAGNKGLAAVTGVGGGAFIANEFRRNRARAELEEESGLSFEDVVRGRERSRYEQLRQERLRAQQNANIERLAALQPELYNQIVAGRRLPIGGIAIGGIPNLELLQQVAGAMGEQRVPGGVVKEILFPDQQDIFEGL